MCFSLEYELLMKNFENHMLSKASPKAVAGKLQKSTKLTGLACFLVLAANSILSC